MPNYTTESIRTIALVGHGAAGKTSLAEALLHAAGTIQHKGLGRKRQYRLRFRSSGKNRRTFAV